VNDALLAPARTTTSDGTVKFSLLLTTVTRAPPPGAAAVSVIVQVDWTPPFRKAGLQATSLNSAGTAARLNPAVMETPLAVAVMVAGVVSNTAPAAAAKEAATLPEATVTEAGTLRAALLVEMETRKPPAGAT